MEIPISTYNINLLIQSYLLHSGYKDTMHTFEKTASLKPLPLPNKITERRSKLFQLQIF